MPMLLSIQVGQPRLIEGDEPWLTSIFKTPVDGPLRLEPHNLVGDDQSDRTVHGGPDKAVCAYSADHFVWWRDALQRPNLGAGAFGENFSIEGLTESTVCLGDSFAVGTAIVQVSQPRMPCWKLGRKWNRTDLPKLVVKAGKTGWYFRVIQAGVVAAGDDLRLLERPYAHWPITECNRLAYAKKSDGLDEERHALASCPALSAAWKQSLKE